MSVCRNIGRSCKIRESCIDITGDFVCREWPSILLYPILAYVRYLFARTRVRNRSFDRCQVAVAGGGPILLWQCVSCTNRQRADSNFDAPTGKGGKPCFLCAVHSAHCIVRSQYIFLIHRYTRNKPITTARARHIKWWGERTSILDVKLEYQHNKCERGRGYVNLKRLSHLKASFAHNGDTEPEQ